LAPFLSKLRSWTLFSGKRHCFCFCFCFSSDLAKKTFFTSSSQRKQKISSRFLAPFFVLFSLLLN
jgi:hypothetical protein